ncbi:MAG TPA: 3-deoxy-manno-octulosonate cytidylyltransferase [Steroidobacteraceae bacterium]|nr:3-deoxy-manno-octulosonate cytidylyltransferase [Steroidobacteraceae bacterium]
MFRVVIPARFDSSRLPGKVLLPIAGRPMLQWVCERARASGAAQVVVATDDERIRSCAAEAGVECVMTASSHVSGTDRIAEASRTLGWGPTDVIVNLQSDEPLMPPALIGQVARLLQDHADADVATLAAPITSAAEFLDPNAVKVVLAADGRALLFSRAPIPWDRDGAVGDAPGPHAHVGALRHIGLYAYRVASLLRISQLPPAELETREKLEQLRALANGLQIRVAIASSRPGVDVNTPGDLARIRALLESSAAAANQI